jgi:hypothetical protein
VLVVACAPGPFTPRSSVTGVVISADGPNVAQVDRFSIRTSEGQVLEFTVGTLELANGGLPAPHLREHLVSGEPITVDYRDENGEKVAIRYTDALE